MERKKMRKQLTGKRDDTPLHSAARAGNVGCVIDILSGAEEIELQELLSRQNQCGETALYVAAEYGHVPVVEEMIKYYDIVAAGIKARNGLDAFHIAAKQGDLDVLRLLVEALPDLTMTVDALNTTALHTAAMQGHAQVVSFLMESGSGLATISKSNGKTALHSAARNGHLQVLKLLLLTEPSLAKRVDKKGQTALHMAAKGQNVEVVEELINLHPTTVNMVDTKGNTALHIATRKGRVGIVTRLLSHPDTDTKVVNRCGETAIDTAEKTKHPEVGVILASHGVQSAKILKPQPPNPARELKQTVSDIKHEVHNQLEHTRQTRKRVQGIAKRISKMHSEGLNNAINSTTVVAVLIATVAFAAIFTVPGQYVDDPANISPGQSLGQANIALKPPFVIFFIFDSIALFISLAVVVVQTSVVIIDSKAKKQMMAYINKLMWLACVLVSVAFLSLSFVVVGDRQMWLAVAVTVIGTTIMATTLGTMCYWIIQHRMEASNLRNIRPSSMNSAGSRSFTVSVLSDTEILNKNNKMPNKMGPLRCFLSIPDRVEKFFQSKVVIGPADMDEELLELQRQFEFAQQAKSSIRLSDRNVVELVQKLQLLKIIDFELLHTVSGKEYITPEKLRSEMVEEIKKSGRVSVIDIADTVGVDLYHVEKQAQIIVSEDSGLMMVQGEVISQSYWDTVAEDINDRLQECSQIALAELSAQLQVGSELMVSVLEPRLGTMVKGRLEGGQLYTPGYVARVGAMVCGASRALTVPTNLSSVWSYLQQLLQETEVASGVVVEGVFFQSLFNGLLKEGEILGSLRAGTHWTPTVFVIAQKECVDSFFLQNSFISYDALHKLAIPQPAQYLQTRYPEGIPLVTLFVHPSMIEMLNAAADDAIEHGTWFAALSVLPTSFGLQDASKILSLCPSVNTAIKSNKALTFGESYVFSDMFIKDLFTGLEKEMETISFSGSTFDDQMPVKEAKGGHEPSRSTVLENANENGNKSSHEKASKKKKGKSAANGKNNAAEVSLDSIDSAPTKSKRNQKKGKESQAIESKGGAKNLVDKAKEQNIPSEEWIMEKIMKMVPDFEEQGMEDPESTLRPVASYLRPKLHNLWKDKRKALFTENIEKIRRVLDNLQKKLDEPFLNIQLYEKALDLFDDDPPTSVILHKHLLRTTAASMVDILLVDLDKHNKLKNGIEVEETSDLESAPLSPGDRISVAKGLPGSLSAKALVVVETLEGKRVEAFTTAMRDAAEESGLSLRKLDKKLERTLLHSYRKDLTCQVSAETDPVPLLPKVVSLLHLQVYSRALQAPGRAINACISRLEDKLDASSYKILLDYHRATVSLLALMSASTGDREDCSANRALTKRELLESLMPALKALVLNPKATSKLAMASET